MKKAIVKIDKKPKIPKGFEKLDKLSKSGAEIADELCYCGHLKSSHEGLQKHGACMFHFGEDCGCAQFTWYCFLKAKPFAKDFKTGKDPLHSGAVSDILKRVLEVDEMNI